MHKKAEQRMVESRGGIRSLDTDLQDELLRYVEWLFLWQSTQLANRERSEFLLPILLHGRFIIERDTNDVLIRFQEDRPLKMSSLNGLPPCFSILAYRRLLNTPIANILRDFSEFYKNPQDCHESNQDEGSKKCAQSQEMKKIAETVERLGPQSLEHAVCIAFWLYVFNMHNKPRQTRNYLSILKNVALEMVTNHIKGPVNERQCTIWTIATIGATASLSPWRLDLPFMGHIIEWMEDDRYLDNLTNMLRGYYLYGASKEVLRSGLDNWYKD